MLIYKNNSAKVIINKNEQNSIIKMVHNGAGNSAQSLALSSHRSRNVKQSILKSRFYWPNMNVDIRNYIKECNSLILIRFLKYNILLK